LWSDITSDRPSQTEKKRGPDRSPGPWGNSFHLPLRWARCYWPSLCRISL